MVLSIKNRQAEQLAQELGDLTGESTSTAVTEALRERLDRVRREQADELVGRLLQIGRDCAAHLKSSRRTLDHGKLLHDKQGLPR